MNRGTVSSVSAAVAATIAASPLFAADFIPLGDLAGGAFDSAGFNVSPDGTAVVGVGVTEAGVEGFRWSLTTGLVSIGDLPGGGVNCYPPGVAGHGAALAGTGDNGAGFAPFVWTPYTGLVELDDVADGDGYNLVADMSADGRVVIGDARRSDGRFECYRWTAEDGYVDLGLLPGATSGIAGGCNVDASAIAGASISPAGWEATLWTASAGLVGLGDLPGGIFNAWAVGVTPDADVVIGYGASDNGYEAFRWTASSGMVGLGDLPGGVFDSWALDLSADGAVIVGVGNTADSQTDADAFIWTEADGMRKLQDVLVNDHGLAAELAGWRLLRANAVSADGTVITGYGLNPDGLREAYVAIIEPQSCAADLNGDGTVDAGDLAIVLAAWGGCP